MPEIQLLWVNYNRLEVWPKFAKRPEFTDQPWLENLLGLCLSQLARRWALVAKLWDWAAETAVGLTYSLLRVCLRSETRAVSSRRRPVL